MRNPNNKKRRPIINIGRFGEILSVLIKFGFGDFVSNLNIDKYTSFTAKYFPLFKQRNKVKRISRWERIRFSLEELGPTFIKFGQFMSNRPDILPEELIKELEKLQDSVKTVSVKNARFVLEHELQTSLSDIVKDFNDIPIASASLAQVHKATLKNGEKVAFKIQKPKLTQTVATDMNILYHLSYLAEKRFSNLRALKITQIIEEFERTVKKEMDFSFEASHIERFQRDFKQDTRMYIPKVYRNFSTKRVLTTEFVNGIKVTETEKIKKIGLDTRRIAENGAHLVLSQLFDHGFFHADPHPGNILVLKNGSICFLDFGAVGIIAPTLRYHLSIILYGLIKKDTQKVVRTLSQLSYERIENIEQLEYDVAEFIEEYSLVVLKRINLGTVLQRFTNIIVEHNIKIIPGLYLLLKTLITLEGIGVVLDPSFCLSEYFEPYIRKLIKNYSRVHNLKDDLYFTLLDLASLIKDLPFEVKDTLRIVKSGDLRIQFEHQGLERMISQHSLQVNRLVFAIVVAALIVGSSIVVHSHILPTIHGISVIGIVGFLIAAIIGFGLIFSIIRKNKI